MKKLFSTLKDLYLRLTSMTAGGIYLIALAVVIGAATFIENDFGTSTAQKLVYRARWFEVLLLLIGLSVLRQIIRYRMWRRQKWHMLLFHGSILVILLGAALTRYFGMEGMMHIREKSSTNIIQSREPYLNFRAVHGPRRYVFHKEVLFGALGKNTFTKDYILGNLPLRVEVLQVIPNPEQTLKDDPNGQPTLWIVMAGMGGRKNYFLRQGEVKNFDGITFNFEAGPQPSMIQIEHRDSGLMMRSMMPVARMVMASQYRDSMQAGVWYPLTVQALHTLGRKNFVFKEFRPKAVVEIQSAKRKLEPNDKAAVVMRLSTPVDTQEIVVIGSESFRGEPVITRLGDLDISVSYGPRDIQLPFSLYLEDFRLVRYPGTNDPASYESDVVLIDPRKNLEMPYSIYMNHILNYDGYRFFQSSYDRDELGTVLSVNWDPWGTAVSYLGYALLTIGMIWMFFAPKSRFRLLAKKI